MQSVAPSDGDGDGDGADGRQRVAARSLISPSFLRFRHRSRPLRAWPADGCVRQRAVEAARATSAGSVCLSRTQEVMAVPVTSADLAALSAARDGKSAQRAVPKGAWSKEEDETVMRLVGLYGPTR